MNNRDKLSAYSYGINKFSYCVEKQTNQIIDNLLIMNYGYDKLFIFPKEKSYELVCAILDETVRKDLKLDRQKFKFEAKFFGLTETLDNYLKGKGFIMISKFRSSLEYINNIQNEFVGLTGMNLQGKFIAKNLDELFKDGFCDIKTYKYSEFKKEYLGKEASELNKC